MDTIPLFVSTEWLAERMGDPSLRIIDATAFLKIPEDSGEVGAWSGRDEYNGGHIPGAVFADLMNELSDQEAEMPFTVPPREQFLAQISRLGVGDGTYAVIYDQGNALVGSPVAAAYWASRLAWQLRYEGYGNIAVLDGGLTKWKEEGRPISTEPGHYPAAVFTGERRDELIATKEDVKKAINDESIVLINSLSPEDFRGETETYPRKGHIPGSKNVFFGVHANEKTKELFSDKVLRETFEKTGALDLGKKVITYCGGGIAATWNALILNKLGQKNVAVYDGSMNEWASDSECPLVTGSE